MKTETNYLDLQTAIEAFEIEIDGYLFDGYVDRENVGCNESAPYYWNNMVEAAKNAVILRGIDLENDASLNKILEIIKHH
jgi:hypothetical protein